MPSGDPLERCVLCRDDIPITNNRRVGNSMVPISLALHALVLQPGLNALGSSLHISLLSQCNAYLARAL